MYTRNSVGITVQAISRGVLWLGLLTAMMPFLRRYLATNTNMRAIRNTNHRTQNHQIHIPMSSVDSAFLNDGAPRSHQSRKSSLIHVSGLAASVSARGLGCMA